MDPKVLSVLGWLKGGGGVCRVSQSVCHSCCHSCVQGRQDVTGSLGPDGAAARPSLTAGGGRKGLRASCGGDAEVGRGAGGLGSSPVGRTACGVPVRPARSVPEATFKS